MPIHDTTIVFYIIALIALAGLHVVLISLGRPRVRFAAVPEGPRCQGCGYILFGQPPLVCPECGRDALPDLLIDKSRYPPTPPIAAILAAALLLFPLTIAAGYPIAARFPQSWWGEAQRVIGTPAGDVIVWAAVRGRGSGREIRGNEVVFPETPRQQRFHMNLEDMTLKPRRGMLIAVTRTSVLGLLGISDDKSADVAMLAAADEIIGELQSLRDNRWAEDRFRYEMTGHYLIDPDDNGGPFFWLPSYAPACVPVWILLSIVAGRGVWRRHGAAMVAYVRECGGALRSL